jgi:putative endonuclease
VERPRRFVNRFCGRSGAGSVPAHGLAPQNLSSDKHVDVCVDSDEDRGSTPLASSLRSPRSGEPRLSRRSLGEGGHTVCVERVCCELRLGKPLKKNATLCLRSILQSESNPEHFYTGRTDDLRDRLIRHNDGKVPHTAKWRVWQIKTYIALSDSERAAKLERYLKSGSGRAFLKKAPLSFAHSEDKRCACGQSALTAHQI